jgi:hypothetical protein
MANRAKHLGDFNDLMLARTLSGVEMGLALAGVPHSPRRRCRSPRNLTHAAQDVREQAVQAVLATASPVS